jgi:hypothetical protein
MGYEVSVYNKDGREIDFLARKEQKEYLIQVAYSIGTSFLLEDGVPFYSPLGCGWAIGV